MSSEVKNKRKPAATAPRFNDVDFVRYELTDEEKLQLKQSFAPEHGLDELLDQITDDGYKLSVKYDAYSEAYAAFLQRSDGKKVNDGQILTGRGRRASSAVFECLFKHYVLFEGQWPERQDKSKVAAWDD